MLKEWVLHNDRLRATVAKRCTFKQDTFNAVFYLNRVNFVLRGGDEHWKLKLSQFVFRDTLDPDNPGEVIWCVEYTKHGSKNRHGGRLQLNQENKVVTQFARPQLGDRCHVFLLEL